MRYMSLCEICTPKQWPTLTLKQLSGKGFPVYGANGIIGYHDIYNHEQATVMIGCRGTCGQVTISEEKAYINGNAMCLDNLSDSYDKKFILYYLQNYDFSEIITGSSQPQITRESLKKVLIPIVSKEVQLNVVSHFDKLYELIVARRLQLAKLDQLVKSRFIELFGDMLLNEMKWDEVPLESLADVVSGITKGRKVRETDLTEVPYMAVSNVKDGYIDWTTVKTIMATKQEIEQYRLLPYDVLMTEGGDPDKLGRGAVIAEPLENSIHQNHIFRVRLQTEKILPFFFSEYLQHQKAKRYFLRSAKQTTGIASINMKQLRALPVLVPPLELQEQFAAFVEQTDKSKLAIQQSLDKLELLKKSLMQKYFG